MIISIVQLILGLKCYMVLFRLLWLVWCLFLLYIIFNGDCEVLAKFDVIVDDIDGVQSWKWKDMVIACQEVIFHRSDICSQYEFFRDCSKLYHKIATTIMIRELHVGTSQLCDSLKLINNIHHFQSNFRSRGEFWYASYWGLIMLILAYLVSKPSI